MTPSLTSRLSLIMIRTQATTVAVRAVGATNQKSWGDPNQQSGVMNTAQKMISLQGVIQSNTCNHVNHMKDSVRYRHKPMYRVCHSRYHLKIHQNIVHELGTEDQETHSCPILNTNDAEGGEVATKSTKSFLSDGWIWITTFVLLEPMIIYRMVIVEGRCTMARSSSLGANCSLVDTKV